MVPRKLFHFSGMAIPVVYLLGGKTAAVIVTAGLLLAAGVVEFFRLRGLLRIDLIEKLTKDRESKRPTGSFFYILASLATILLYRKDVAVASIFVLAISDPLSSLAGFRWGRRPLLGKTLEGTLVFFASAAIILLISGFSVPVALAGSVVAALTELLSSGAVDDNLSIPLVTGLTLTILTL
jgi:dolichol kinase